MFFLRKCGGERTKMARMGIEYEIIYFSILKHIRGTCYIMSVGWLLYATNIEYWTIQWLLTRFHIMAKSFSSFLCILFFDMVFSRTYFPSCIMHITHTYINWWRQWWYAGRRMLSQPRKTLLLLLLIKLRCFRFLCVSFSVNCWYFCVCVVLHFHGIVVGSACRIKMIEHCECWIISWPKFSVCICMLGMDSKHRRIYITHECINLMRL